MSFLVGVKAQFDSCTSENRGKLFGWFRQAVVEGFPEVAFKVGLKCVCGNTAYWWDSVFALYFATVGPANPTLLVDLNRLKYMETTNSIGMLSILLCQSPKSGVVAMARDLCGSWPVPLDDSVGLPADWRQSFEKALGGGELFQSLYFAHLLFQTRKGVSDGKKEVKKGVGKRNEAKLEIWRALLETTSNHWYVRAVFTIAMTPTLQWKPVTFDMIILLIHLVVTGSLNELEDSETVITKEVRVWVETLEKIPIGNFLDVGNPVANDPFWLNVEKLYAPSLDCGKDEVETGVSSEDRPESGDQPEVPSGEQVAVASGNQLEVTSGDQPEVTSEDQTEIASGSY